MKTFEKKSASIALIYIFILLGRGLMAEDDPKEKQQSRWSVKKVEEYASFQKSDGLAIAVEIMASDALCNQAFEYKNLVSKGILPLLVVIENHADFAVLIEGTSILLALPDSKLTPLTFPQILGTLNPQKDHNQKSRIPLPIPSIPKDHRKGLEQLESRLLESKRVPPGATDYGFLFFRMTHRGLPNEIRYVYIPKMTNLKTGQDLIYVEVPLQPVSSGNMPSTGG